MRTPNLPLIIGLASGFAFLILVLGLMWIFWLQQKRNAKYKWQETLRADLEKHRLDIQVVHSESTFDTSLAHYEKHDEHPYYHTDGDRFTSPPKPHSRIRRSQGPPLYPLVAPPYDPPRAPLRPPRHGTQLTIPMSIARDTSYDSCDSASMYSTASAPIDLHDQIMLGQPVARSLAHVAQPRTSSPLAQPRTRRATHAIHRVSEAEDEPAPAYQIAMAPAISPCSAEYVDPLAPETYDKTHPPRQGSVSLQLDETPVRPHSSGSVRKKRARNETLKKDRDALPAHLRPTLAPPSPLAQRRFMTPLLYRKVSHPSLPSPYSPPTAEVW